MIERLQNVPEAHWLEETRVVAMVRGIPQDTAVELTEALYRGGIRVLEVTMNTAGALEMIQTLRQKYQQTMWIGAGTVLDVESAEAAAAAGASFLVTPHVDEQVIKYGVEHGLPVFSGALTPTEIVKAYRAGAAAVKIFPSRSMGPGYIKELQGPLSHIPLMAVGGVSVENAPDFFAAGVQAIGVGSNLVDKKSITEGNFDRIQRSAQQLIEVVRTARQSSV